MSDQPFFERRSRSDFPNKFSTLPGIGGNDSPTPNDNNQIMPYGAGRVRSPLTGMRPHTDSNEAEERLRQLETRVNVAEKSNRALLEEVIRLQSELKAQIRRNDDIVREERTARLQIENTLRGSSDLVAQLSSRLTRTEEKLQDEKSAMTALVNHTKNVEQAMLGSQQDLVSRREQTNNKLQELRNELGETARAKDQLERVVFTLVDEMRQVKSKTDSQTQDFSAVAMELRNKSKRLEEENRQTLETMRKQGETQSHTDTSTSQLRNQIEARLAELRDVLVDLRNKQETETQGRRILEQQLQVRMGDMSASIVEQNRRREEAMHALEVIQREKEHAAETERIKLQGKIAEIAEEVSKKILQKEMRLREENQAKYSQLEKVLHAEQEARQQYEKDVREENEKRWDTMKKLTGDEISSIRETQKLEKKKVNETVRKLNEAVNLLDKQLEGHQKQQGKVISAEIKSRKQHEKDTMERIDGVQEKLGIAMATLQQAIGGINAQMTKQGEKVRREMKALFDDHRQAETRALADLDTRLTALQAKVLGSEDRLEGKVAAATRAQTESLRDKVIQMELEQDMTKQSVRDMQTQVQRLPEDVYALEEKVKLLKNELNTRVNAEADSRIRDIENLRERVQMGGGKGGGATKEDVEACQTSIRKLAESIQTVKTVLGMKIQSEQKLRVEEVKNLQDDLIRLQSLVEPLLRNKPEPRLFVKPTGVDNLTAEKNAPAINKWSMYTAYRWLYWKTRWMYVKWKKDAKWPKDFPELKDQKSARDKDPKDDKKPSDTNNKPDANTNNNKN